MEAYNGMPCSSYKGETECIHSNMKKDLENAVLKGKKNISRDAAHCININLKCITKLYDILQRYMHIHPCICLYILVCP